MKAGLLSSFRCASCSFIVMLFKIVALKSTGHPLQNSHVRIYMPCSCHIMKSCIFQITNLSVRSSSTSSAAIYSESALSKVKLWCRKLAAIVASPELLILAPQDQYGPSHSFAVSFECVPGALPPSSLCGHDSRIPMSNCTSHPGKLPPS